MVARHASTDGNDAALRVEQGNGEAARLSDVMGGEEKKLTGRAS
jgi:hypothetical protein